MANNFLNISDRGGHPNIYCPSANLMPPGSSLLANQPSEGVWGRHKVKILIGVTVVASIAAVTLAIFCFPAAFGVVGAYAAANITGALAAMPLWAKITVIATAGVLSLGCSAAAKAGYKPSTVYTSADEVNNRFVEANSADIRNSVSVDQPAGFNPAAAAAFSPKDAMPPQTIERELYRAQDGFVNSDRYLPADISKPIKFDFLSPNEANPQDILKHFAKIPNQEEGKLVTCGTERAVFDLLLGNFQSVISIDIEPRVKAYLDFLTLLVHVAKDRTEFCSFAAGPMNEQLKNIIRERVQSSNMQPILKTYHLQNFESYSTVYYDQPKRWNENPSFSAVNYYADDALFSKFQKYVREDRFISISGDINNLSAFDNVLAIDTSNISVYSFLLPSARFASNPPLIIWTSVKPIDLWAQVESCDWNFFSYRLSTPNPLEMQEMQWIADAFSKTHGEDCLRYVLENALDHHLKKLDTTSREYQVYQDLRLSFPRSVHTEVLERVPMTAYSPDLHHFLRSYVVENFYDASKHNLGLGLIDFGADREKNNKLQNLDPTHMKKIISDPNIARFMPQLARHVMNIVGSNLFGYEYITNKTWINELSKMNEFQEAFNKLYNYYVKQSSDISSADYSSCYEKISLFNAAAIAAPDIKNTFSFLSGFIQESPQTSYTEIT